MKYIHIVPLSNQCTDFPPTFSALSCGLRRSFALNFMAYASRSPAFILSIEHMAWMDVFLDLKPPFDLRRCERERRKEKKPHSGLLI